MCLRCVSRQLSYCVQPFIDHLSPSHAYTYSFEPNPSWSSFYAYGPEIKEYFQNFAKKYDLMPHVKLNARVLGAVWQEDRGICE